jgi:hypothetical protein
LLAADVVIDEIMYHAASPTTPGQPAIGEYIEIYNHGNASANQAGGILIGNRFCSVAERWRPGLIW